jgi:hypothetical protein
MKTREEERDKISGRDVGLVERSLVEFSPTHSSLSPSIGCTVLVLQDKRYARKRKQYFKGQHQQKNVYIPKCRRLKRASMHGSII